MIVGWGALALFPGTRRRRVCGRKSDPGRLPGSRLWLGLQGGAMDDDAESDMASGVVYPA